MHIDLANFPSVLDQEKEAIEKILMLIEKISSQEVISQRHKKLSNTSINSTNKVDLLPFFRKKYKFYFDLKNEAQLLTAKA